MKRDFFEDYHEESVEDSEIMDYVEDSDFDEMPEDHDDRDELEHYQAEKERDENEVYEDYDEEDASCRYRDYEWTDEDSWDALTDGMYGDMPRNPIAYDAMMDAMGF